jgi:rod shape-determining protein MreC
VRNLFLFIARFHAFLFFVALEALAVVLMVQNNRFHQAGFFNSANYMSGVMFERYSNVTGYFRLKDVNERLARENAWLRSQLPGAYYNDARQQVDETDSTRRVLYSYVPAEVVNVTTNARNNYITINRGSRHGIKPHMGVISPDGIVGVVKSVSEHFSVVLPVLHSDFEASGRVGDEKFIGAIKWDGHDPRFAQLAEIPKQIAVKPGDAVTTAASRLYPEGLMIGTVEKVSKNTPHNFYDIEVRLATPFPRLTHVYVINYLLRDEQNQLEEQAQR